jgi:NTP pyrophosphatase (non-canonical NTP hydrolase)
MGKQFTDDFKELSEQVRANAERHGFEASMDNFPEKIALIHSETTEALEDWRKNREEHIGKELADIVIRVMDLAEGIDIDLGEEILTKIEENEQREHRHGGRKI